MLGLYIFRKMKYLILLILSLTFLISGYAQETQSNDVYFTSVYVQHRLRKTGIAEEVMISLGHGEKHPLKGKLINVENTFVRVTEGASSYNLNSESEVLSFFVNRGWEIIDTQIVKIVGSDYHKYLLRK